MSFTPSNPLEKAMNNFDGVEYCLGTKRALGEPLTKTDVFVYLIARIIYVIKFKGGRPDETWSGLLTDAISQNMSPLLKKYLVENVDHLRKSNPDYEMMIMTPALVSLSLSMNLDPYLLKGLEESLELFNS